ncbi:MAG: hypothetical protein HY055_01510 [Magnetospirillum sp.]|nr:hypothetical protein [Magnetospirillum sp.]
MSAGTRLAAAISDKISYDVHWPTAYGLGRLSCGLEGAKTCPPPPAMPKDKWKDSFAEAAAQVAHYYRDNGRK